MKPSPQDADYCQKVDQTGCPHVIFTSPEVCRRRPHARRFFKAFAIGALAMFLFHFFMHKFNFVFLRALSGCGKKSVFPVDIHVDHCAQWPDEVQPQPDDIDHPFKHPYFASTSFELPFSSDSLFLLSRGHFSVGVVEILYSNEVADVVKVNVTTEYDHPELLKGAKVCQLTRAEGENGIGIFTRRKRHRSHRKHLQFKVVVHLPATTEGPPLQINNFQTDMPLFLHKIGDLKETVHFRSVSLKTLNMPIWVDSLSAGAANITTANSPIEGSFSTSSTLRLTTANAHIKANVSLTHGGESKATVLIATTSNAPLEAYVSLYSSQNNHTGGQFNVTATTSLSPIHVGFPTAPVDSILSVDASTRISPATVELHESYEGSFSLATSLNRPSLDYSEDVEDPADRGRHRVIEIQSHYGRYLDGNVYWDPSGNSDKDKDKPSGSVHVITSFSPVVLNL